MHFAHTRAQRPALHDFHDPNRPCSKKSFRNKNNLDNHIQFFLYEKFKELDYISNHKTQCTCI